MSVSAAAILDDRIKARPSLLYYPDPRLQLICDPVQAFDGELHSLLDDMWAVMEGLQGIGLAAPQLGAPSRVAICHVPGGCKIEICNPEIVREWGGAFTSNEGCLSWPGKTARITRSRRVKVKGQDRYGGPVSFGGNGLQAAVLRHEIDHLDGINIADRKST